MRGMGEGWGGGGTGNKGRGLGRGGKGKGKRGLWVKGECGGQEKVRGGITLLDNLSGLNGPKLEITLSSNCYFEH